MILQDRFGHRQFGATVDADEFGRRRLYDRAGGTVTARNGDNIRQIVFTLRVCVADAIEQPVQALAINGHDAGVAEPDGTLLRRGIAELDNSLKPPLRVDDQAAVFRRIGRPHAEDDDGWTVRGTAALQ